MTGFLFTCWITSVFAVTSELMGRSLRGEDLLGLWAWWHTVHRAEKSTVAVGFVVVADVCAGTLPLLPQSGQQDIGSRREDLQVHVTSQKLSSFTKTTPSICCITSKTTTKYGPNVQPHDLWGRLNVPAMTLVIFTLQRCVCTGQPTFNSMHENAGISLNYVP